MKVFVVSTAALLAMPAGALAQDAPPSRADVTTEVIDEIVVTARFRAERLLDVSQSISAFDGQSIEARGLGDLSGVASLVPGLELVDRGSSRKSVALRGVGRLVQLDDNIQSAPTVGLYLDDIPYATIFANQRDIPSFDLAGIEVLRGPQGTLYGEGSMAGTIKFNTRKPDLDEIELRTLGTISATEDGGTNTAINGAVNLPLIPGRLALRAVAYREKDDGYIDRAVAGQPAKEDDNRSARKGGRLLLRAAPSERLDVELGAYYDRTRNRGSSVVAYERADDLVNDTKPGPEDRRDRLTVLRGRLDFNTGFGTFSSITGYLDRKLRSTYVDVVSSRQLYLAAGMPLPPKTSPLYSALAFRSNVDIDEEVFTQELRFVSNFGGPLQLTLGGYYKESDTALANDTFLNPAAPVLDLDQSGKSRQWSAFGEAALELSDQLTARAGLRYFDEKLETQLRITAPAPLAIPFPLQTNNISKLLPRFTLELKPAADHLLYASAAAGARNGGFNSPFAAALENGAVARFNQNLPADNQIPVTFPDVTAVSAYDADSLWTYEIGSKNSFQGGRLRVDLAAFYTEWKDLQIRTLTPVANSVIFANLGKARIYGIEALVNWHITTGLSLGISGALQKAEAATRLVYRAGVPQIGTPDLLIGKGDRLPNARSRTVTLTLDYVRPIAAEWNLTVLGSYSYSSGALNEFAFDRGFPVPGFDNRLEGYGIANIRAGFQRDDFSIQFFVDNITNEHVVLGVLPRSDEAYVNRPRTFGVTVAADF